MGVAMEHDIGMMNKVSNDDGLEGRQRQRLGRDFSSQNTVGSDEDDRSKLSLTKP